MAIGTHPMAVGAQGLRALLVEDDDLDARLLTAFADMNGECAVHFTRARTMAEAMRLTVGDTFDMYFVDLHLGDRSSLALLSRLEEAGARPIVVSNATRREATNYRLESGAVRFLSKGDCSALRIGAFVHEALVARQATCAA